MSDHIYSREEIIQAVLPLLETDLMEIFMAVSEGELRS